MSPACHTGLNRKKRDEDAPASRLGIFGTVAPVSGWTRTRSHGPNPGARLLVAEGGVAHVGSGYKATSVRVCAGE